MAHCQVGYDLVSEGVADEHRAFQPDFPNPGAASPSRPGRDGASRSRRGGQLGCIGPMVGSQALEGGIM